MARLYIIDKYPAEYASGVYINDVVWAQFSVPIASGTATYYNFTVGEKNTYEPVEGTVMVQAVSGGLNDAMVVFYPTDGFKRNTEYSVLVSTGITTKNAPITNLEDDVVWYFKTGILAASGLPLDPSGVSEDDSSSTDVVSSSGDPLVILETYPEAYAINVSPSLPFIGIRFSGILPSGIDLQDHVTLSARGVLG